MVIEYSVPRKYLISILWYCHKEKCLIQECFYVYLHIENVCVPNSFHRFHFTEVKCATHELFEV